MHNDNHGSLELQLHRSCLTMKPKKKKKKWSPATERWATSCTSCEPLDLVLFEINSTLNFSVKWTNKFHTYTESIYCIYILIFKINRNMLYSLFCILIFHLTIHFVECPCCTYRVVLLFLNGCIKFHCADVTCYIMPVSCYSTCRLFTISTSN